MDSYTLDGITTKGGDDLGEFVWEWDWNCVVPNDARGEGEREGRECEYKGGEVIEMPGRGEGSFIGGGEEKEFEVGVPLYFVVRVRVRKVEEGRLGEVVSEGRYEEIFSFVEEGEGEEWIVEESQWMCENGAIGYSVRIFFLELLLFILFFFFCID